MKLKEKATKVNKHYSKQNGITLIALVVTIVVLLILAGVTINAVFNQNGLIKRIDTAKEKAEIAEYVDDLNRKVVEVKINVLNDESRVLEEVKEIIAEDTKYDEAVMSQITGENEFTVTTKEGYRINVTKDGATFVEKVSNTPGGETETTKAILTLKHINRQETELKAQTETEYNKDTIVTVKSETIEGYKTYSIKITANDTNEILSEGSPIETSFAIYRDTEVVITYEAKQVGETEKVYEEKPTISNATNSNGETQAVVVKPIEKTNNIKDSLPAEIKNEENSYMVDIEPVESGSGPLTITLDVSDKARDGDTANIRHYKNNVWEDLGDYTVEQGKITITINSFSPFCITIKKSGSQTPGGETNPETPSNDLPSTSDTTPYFPDNTFTKLANTDLSNGLVIQDSTGNEYVWIEVPKNLYNNESYNTETTGADKKPANSTDYDKIEYCLHKYTNYYRNGTAFKDTQYTTLKQKMLKSVYENGGFWIGRYEAGITTNRTESGTAITTPISKAGTVETPIYPYNYVTCMQAQTLANQLTTLNYTSSLMFGVQWDLVLKHIEVKEVENGTALATIQNALRSDSKDWGNYYNATFTINRGKYGDYTSTTWKPYDETTAGFVNSSVKQVQSSGNGILLTTGASDTCKKMNIYDLAGNVWEWTLEDTADTYLPCVIRGGDCDHTGGVSPSAFRGNFTRDSHGSMGFRSSLYK